MDLNINQKDVVELAAQKVADAILSDYDDLHEMAQNRIEEAINSVITDEVKASMIEAIDKKLADETEKVLSQKIVPVDIWGEGRGEPTTIREQLHKRALEYWEERVEPDRNNRGRYQKTNYGGEPRHKLVFKDVAQAAFEEAMRTNVNEMVRAFRDAMKKDAASVIGKHIESIINNRVVDGK